MPSLGPYQVLEPLSQRDRAQRLLARRGQRRFWLTRVPSCNEAEQLARWLGAATARAGMAPIPPVVEAIEVAGSGVLVQEAIDGRPLSALLETTLDLDQRIDLALRLTEAVGHLHRHGLVYNAPTWDNLLSDASDFVWLSDCSRVISLADQASASGVAAKPGSDLSDAELLYAAPERTGKVALPIGLPADLYAIGVMLYRLFCARFPFVAERPAELISLQVAGTPGVPAEIVPDLPRGLSSVILRLLEKDPERRYASTEGLLYDLRHFGDTGFVPGTQDVAPVPRVSRKVYGRDAEVSALRDLMAQLPEGASACTLIAGYSGVGKSTLVRTALDAPEVRAGYRLISGKFQQYKRSIPYFAFVEALDQLVEGLLLADESEINVIRRDFEEIIGDQGGVLTASFPRLELVFGTQPEVEKLLGVEAENRFRFLFLRLVGLLARADRPLLLFLDDLQWSDVVSLRVLKALIVSRTAHLMILLAYRDNEVDRHHPFQQMLDELDAQQVPLQRVQVRDLAAPDIDALLTDTLRTPNPELGAVIRRKTHGNAFFVHQFLKNLVDQDLLHLDRERRVWRVDQKRVESLEISENVVDLMQQRIGRMDPQTRDLLRLTGALGHNAPLSVLAVVTGRPPQTLRSLLAKPIADGMLSTRGERIVFVHDKIQQACYQLNAPAELPQLHLELAELLLEHGLDQTPEDLFNLTSHLSKGFDCIAASHDRYGACFLRAARTSRELSAYDECLRFVGFAVRLLEQGSDPALALHCRREQHLALHLNGRYDEADAVFAEHLAHLDDLFGLQDNLIAKVSQGSMLGHYREATRFGLDILRRLDIDISPDPGRGTLVAELASIRAELDRRGIEQIDELLQVPRRREREMTFLCELISAIVPPSFFYNPMVSGLLIFATIRLALKNGVYTAMGYPFSTSTAPFIIVENNYRSGYEYGRFAIRISETNKRALGNSKHLFILFAYHWMKPLKDDWCLEVAREAFHLLMQGGDIQMAGFVYFNTVPIMIERGDPLPAVLKEVDKGLDFAERTQNFHALGTYRLYRQLALSLSAADGDTDRFSHDGFDEQRHLAEFERNGMAHCYFHILKTQLLYSFRHFDQALPHARGALARLWHITGFMPVATGQFYAALTLCRALPTDPSVAVELRPLLAQWRTWAEQCPENWQHRLRLIEAELAVGRGDTEGAIRAFGPAVVAARRSGFTEDVALCCERFADLWLQLDNRELAEVYLGQARTAWERWGATRKVLALEAEFPELLPTAQRRDFDLLNIIEAQNLLARETRFETLIRRLLALLLEVSGAERVLLLQQHGDDWRVDGYRDTAGREQVLQNQPLDQAPLLIEAVNYSVRSGAEAGLEHLAHQASSSRKRPASLLVLPVVSQSRTVALLYLDHGGIADLFPEPTREAIRLLSAQIAISLVNARAYDELETQVAERTRDLAQRNAELREAQALADEAARAKSSFLANMSHEIRTPLNAVLGMANLLKISELSPRQRGYVSSILSAGGHLLGVINDVLDFSKIEAQRLTLERVHFHLGSVLDSVAGIVGHQAREKGLELAFSCPPELLRAYVGDPLRLSQVLTNLIGNAIKFTERGEVMVSVESAPAPETDMRLRFSVRDTGIGLSAQQRERLFQPFSQADDSTTRRFGGSGLGLSICARLVALMGGVIDVDSEPGAGSTFRFEIPLEPGVDSGEAQARAYRSLQGKEALVVEDNSSTRRALVGMLRAIGFRVSEAAGADELRPSAASTGKAGAVRSGFDLVLLDWELPANAAPEVVRRFTVEASADRPAPPILAMASPEARERLGDRLAQVGLAAVLLKPVNPSLLMDATMRVATNHSLPRDDFTAAVDWDPQRLHALTGARILVAEDNPLNLAVLREMLEQAGLRVDSASNGREVLHRLADSTYDLVFMDIQMPEMDGYEATRQLRRNPALAQLPVIALTAHALESERRACLAAGMNEHLSKPLDPGKLADLLLRWIPPRQPPAAPAIGRDAEAAAEAETVAASLSHRIPVPRSPQVAGAPHQVRDLLRRQADLLKHGSFQAAEHAQRVERALEGLVPVDELGAFSKQAAMFDYESAEQALRRLARRLGIALDGDQDT